MLEIPVELGARRYAISIGHGLTAMLPALLERFAGRRVVAVISRRVWSLHGRRLERPLRRIGQTHRVLLPDGERFKSRSTLNALHDEFLKIGLARDGLVIAVGGGVVGDLTGYAAATYMRGVDWIPIPTTLLAMVDSSVGGKTGINHPLAKNAIGAFHQPRAVVIDPVFLETLPRRELQGGAYEVLKSALLGDRALFRSLRNAPPGLVDWDHKEMENAIASSCRIKAEVVEKDEREGDLRRVLNLGHTIGHALESVTHYRRFTHGEAVGWGIIGVSWMALKREMLSESSFDAIAATVDRMGPRPRLSDLPTSRILASIKHDKKTRRGRVHFVLPTAIGRVAIRSDVTEREIRSALRVMAAREARLETH